MTSITRLCAALSVCLLTAGLVPRAARAGDDVLDTRVTFVLADENVLSGLPVGVRARPTTFFDNYDTRDEGDETLTHLVLYKQFVGPRERVFTEAGLVARVGISPQIGLEDDGSFVQIAYRLTPTTPALAYLLAYPVSADRFRLGYSYDITWGGDEAFGARTPGFQLGYKSDRFSVFGGLKTVLPNSGAAPVEQRQLYGWLGGGSVQLTNALRWEVGVGHLEQGELPFVSSPSPTDGELVVTRGLSTQLAYEQGLPIERSVDLRPYRIDPRLPWSPFDRGPIDAGWSYRVATELTWMARRLRAFRDPGYTRREVTTAGDASAALRKGPATLTVDVVYRSVGFISYQHPFLAPLVALPRDGDPEADVYVAVGSEYRFVGSRLTPGIVVGMQRPASVAVAELDPGLDRDERYLIRSDGQIGYLRSGARIVPIPSARSFLRWDATEGVVVVAEATFTLDNNLTVLQVTPTGDFESVSAAAVLRYQIALALLVMARF